MNILKIPTLLIHSGEDEAVPLNFSKKALEVSAGQPKKLVIIPDATHNPQGEFAKSVYSAVNHFILELEG